MTWRPLSSWRNGMTRVQHRVAGPAQAGGQRSYWSMMVTALTGWLGAYSSTDPRNKITQEYRPRGGTANEVLWTNLRPLRNQCRDLERKNPVARGIVEGWCANLVGNGIALEPDTGDADTDAKIRAVWLDWCEHAGARGESIEQLLHGATREMVVSGEWLWRYVADPDLARDGGIPVRILALEAEWLADIAVDAPSGALVTQGIETDRLSRITAYHLRNPFTLSDQTPERVPAAYINHGFESRRALQARGEPILATVIETLFQERELVRAELQSAINTAAVSLAITSSMPDVAATDQQSDPVTNFMPGSVFRLFPGESAQVIANTRPSQQIAPFRSMLRGDIASGVRLGQRWLDRDSSRANYSSMRAEQQDDERLFAPVRDWFGRMTVGRVYEYLLPYLAVRAGVATPRAKYRLLPDGLPYVNPVEDITASLLAIDGGLSTREHEISKRGGDFAHVLERLAAEQAAIKAAGLEFTNAKGDLPMPEPKPTDQPQENQA